MTIFDIPLPALLGHLTLGLINGAFYAMLSLGLAVIFGVLRVVNFAHGAQFTLGAFGAWMLLTYAKVPYWGALLLAPLCVALLAMLAEKTLLRRLYELNQLYQILLTFGMALMIEGLLAVGYGSSGLPYENPLPGGVDLGFMYLPYYRAWVIAVSLIACGGTWYLIERTRLGVYLRAATEFPDMVRTFGIDVPKLVTLTYGFGVGLAALAGVLAAPMDQIQPLMGTSLIITVFAVVVIGGMGSIGGAVLVGFALGLVEAMTKLVFPPASNVAIFFIMAVIILLKPAGLFGKAH
jgi:branched-chain amino acid transport system permease protein